MDTLQSVICDDIDTVKMQSCPAYEVVHDNVKMQSCPAYEVVHDNVNMQPCPAYDTIKDNSGLAQVKMQSNPLYMAVR